MGFYLSLRTQLTDLISRMVCQGYLCCWVPGVFDHANCGCLCPVQVQRCEVCKKGCLVISFSALTSRSHSLCSIRDLWNIDNPNRDCKGFNAEFSVIIFHAGMGILIDASILALPIWIVFRKMKFSPKMVRVVLIFCVGALSVIAGALRLIYSVLNFDADMYVYTLQLSNDLNIETIM